MTESTLFTIRAIIAVFSILAFIGVIIAGILANRKLHPKRKWQGNDLSELYGLGNEPEEPKKRGGK